MHPYIFPAVIFLTVLTAIIFAYPMFQYARRIKSPLGRVFATTFSFTAASVFVIYGTCAIVVGDQGSLEWSAWHQVCTIFIAYTCYFTEGKIYQLADKDPKYQSRLDDFVPVVLITFLFTYNMLYVKSIPPGTKYMLLFILSPLVVLTLKKRAFRE